DSLPYTNRLAGGDRRACSVAGDLSRTTVRVQSPDLDLPRSHWASPPQLLRTAREPGCNLYSSLDVTTTFFPASGTGSVPFAIPPTPALAGTVILAQPTVFVPGINPFGF